MHYDILDLMALVVKENAAAVHVTEGAPPLVEMREMLEEIQGPNTEPGEVQGMLASIFPIESIENIRQDRFPVLSFRFSEEVVFKVMVFRKPEPHRMEVRRINLFADAA